MKLKNISSKDLSYISDIFNWNIIVTKKLKSYSDFVTDEEIIKKFNYLYDMHINNCNTLLDILEGNDK